MRGDSLSRCRREATDHFHNIWRAPELRRGFIDIGGLHTTGVGTLQEARSWCREPITRRRWITAGVVWRDNEHRWPPSSASDKTRVLREWGSGGIYEYWLRTEKRLDGLLLLLLMLLLLMPGFPFSLMIHPKTVKFTLSLHIVWFHHSRSRRLLWWHVVATPWCHSLLLQRCLNLN